MTLILAGTFVPRWKVLPEQLTDQLLTALALIIVALTAELQRRELRATLGEHHQQTEEQKKAAARDLLVRLLDLFRSRSDEFAVPASFDNSGVNLGFKAFRTARLLVEHDIKRSQREAYQGEGLRSLSAIRDWIHSIQETNGVWFKMLVFIPERIRSSPAFAEDRSALLQLFGFHISEDMRRMIALAMAMSDITGSRRASAAIDGVVIIDENEIGQLRTWLLTLTEPGEGELLSWTVWS